MFPLNVEMMGEALCGRMLGGLMGVRRRNVIGSQESRM